MEKLNSYEVFVKTEILLPIILVAANEEEAKEQALSIVLEHGSPNLDPHLWEDSTIDSITQL